MVADLESWTEFEASQLFGVLGFETREGSALSLDVSRLKTGRSKCRGSISSLWRERLSLLVSLFSGSCMLGSVLSATSSWPCLVSSRCCTLSGHWEVISAAREEIFTTDHFGPIENGDTFKFQANGKTR